MRRGLSTLFTLLMMLTSTAVLSAVQVKELYDIEIPVADQGTAERNRAIRQGLSDIIIRLTGTQGMEQFGQMLTVLDRASQYVEQYRYHTQTEEEVARRQDPGLLLWVRYNRNTIQQLLQAQQLPLWGSTRPETLLWLVIEDRGGRYILGSDKANPMYQSVLTHAHRRAVPMLLPLMDLEDQRQIRIGDIWGGFSTPVKVASGRYTTDNILIGKVYPASGGWRCHWTLLSGSTEKSWSGSGKFVDQAIATGIDGLADKMAARYAIKTTGELSNYRLVISNVNSLQDYDRSAQYLRSISLISGFQLERISQGQLVYSIDVRGGIAALKQIFNLEQRLLPDDNIQSVIPVVRTIDPVVINNNTAIEIKPLPETLNYRLKP